MAVATGSRWYVSYAVGGVARRRGRGARFVGARVGVGQRRALLSANTVYRTQCCLRWHGCGPRSLKQGCSVDLVFRFAVLVLFSYGWYVCSLILLVTGFLDIWKGNICYVPLNYV